MSEFSSPLLLPLYGSSRPIKHTRPVSARFHLKPRLQSRRRDLQWQPFHSTGYNSTSQRRVVDQSCAFPMLTKVKASPQTQEENSDFAIPQTPTENERSPASPGLFEPIGNGADGNLQCCTLSPTAQHKDPQSPVSIWNEIPRPERCLLPLLDDCVYEAVSPRSIVTHRAPLLPLLDNCYLPSSPSTLQPRFSHRREWFS